MLLKCELMVLKSQINPNTNKNGFLLPTKCIDWVLKYSYLVSIILNYQFPKQCLRIFLCWSCILIALAHTSIALAQNLIALTHLNTTEKMHRLEGDCLRQMRDRPVEFKFISEISKNDQRDQLIVTLYTLSTYPSVHKQLIRSFLTLFEANIVCIIR